MPRSFKPRELHTHSKAPPKLAAHGFFWVGIERQATPGGLLPNRQMYVEYSVPAELKQPWPVVMIHGGGGQGTDFMQTADGRPGWVSYFLHLGYAVYVVDRHGLGRSPYNCELLGPMSAVASYELVVHRFTNPAAAGRYPQARLHTQWPGTGVVGDPSLDQFMAGTGPSLSDLARTHLEMQRGGALLLDEIGPAILLTHSAGGPCGWMIADARPESVKAIVAVEPFGPPFVGLGPMTLEWGLTAAPLTYAPPVTDPRELTRELRVPASADLIACYVQAEPARKLPNLNRFPIVVVTAEASWMAQDNHGTVEFLLQAGANVEHLRLELEGVRGNGHAPMLEKNSDDAAGVLHRWLLKKQLAS